MGDTDADIVHSALEAMRADGAARLLADNDSVKVEFEPIDGLELRLKIEIGDVVYGFTARLHPQNTQLPDVQPDQVLTVGEHVDTQRYLDAKDILAATGAFPETLAALETEYQRVRAAHRQDARDAHDALTATLRQPQNLRAIVQVARAMLAQQRFNAILARTAPLPLSPLATLESEEEADSSSSDSDSTGEWMSGDESVARSKRQRSSSPSSSDDDDEPPPKRLRVGELSVTLARTKRSHSTPSDDDQDASTAVVMVSLDVLSPPSFYDQSDCVCTLVSIDPRRINAISRHCDRVKWIEIPVPSTVAPTVNVAAVCYPVDVDGTVEDMCMVSAHLLFDVWLQPSYGGTFARAFVYTALMHTNASHGTLFQFLNEANVKKLEQHVNAILKGPQRPAAEFQALREHSPMLFLNKHDFASRVQRMLIPVAAVESTAQLFCRK